MSSPQSASPMSPWTVVWITGASTGIGRELALRLAARGAAVAVSARSADKLNDLAALHPKIKPFPLDVTDASATRATVAAIEAQLGPIDLAVLNAGVWDPMGAKDFTAARAGASMDVNFIGLCHGVEAVVPLFLARKAGHLALVASLAGYRGLPQAAAYAPSKAAVISLAEVLKPDLDRHGVSVSVVNPGFVETPMTSVNAFPMPFLMTAAAAAERLEAGLEKRRFEIIFPRRFAWMMKALRILPYGLFFWVSRTFLTPKKKR